MWKREEYIRKKMVFRENDPDRSIKKREKKQEEYWKKKMNSAIFCVTLAS